MLRRTSVLSAVVLGLMVATALGQEKPRLNVLFIAVDDLRPELGCYGHPLIRSPSIDRLARQGLVFTRAYCQQAVCNPSRASLMTGLRPETLKVFDLPTHFRDVYPDAVTIPQHFRSQGYFTQRFGKIFHVGHGNRDDALSWSVPAKRLPVPANASRQARGTSATQPVAARRPKANLHTDDLPYESLDVADNALPDGVIADQAIEALQNVKDRPFFLAVGFHKPHLPFVAPKKYWDLYSADQIRLAANPFHPKDAPAYANNDAGELRSYKGMPKKGAIPDDEARRLIHGYYACVSYTDAQVGRVLAELDKLGLREKTIVILWGDHGWQLGEHATWCKHTAWETATRAPLVISVPGQKNAGAQTDALVEFVDIFPSLVDLCGLPMPPGLEGLSFKPLIENPRREWKTATFSLWPKQIPGQGSGFGRAIRTERYRLVEWSVPGKEFAEYELYDHDADPQENQSLARRPEHKQQVEALAKQLHAGWQVALPGAQTRSELPAPPAGKTWKLVWGDEFDGTTLDETKWDVPPDAVRRDGWWMRQAIQLDGQGHLVMRTIEADGKLVDGCVRTLGRFERAYGLYVARIRLQRQPGHWPAFWLMGRTVGRVGDEGRDGTEIDIMEKPWLDDRVNHALHWDGYGREHKSDKKVATVPGLMHGFHTYALWWSPEEYVFHVDGQVTWRTQAGGVCQAPLYIKLSDEIGKWGGDIRRAKLPDEFLVDYVRVYDLVDE